MIRHFSGLSAETALGFAGEYKQRFGAMVNLGGDPAASVSVHFTAPSNEQDRSALAELDERVHKCFMPRSGSPLRIIWQVDAYRRTRSDAIRAFCNTFWDKPRKFKVISRDGYFKLRDGVATYCCRLVHNLPPIYMVCRIDGPASLPESEF